MSSVDYYKGAEAERSKIIALIDDLLQHLEPRHPPYINSEYIRGNIVSLRRLRRQLFLEETMDDSLDDLRAGVRIACQAAERD